MPADITFDSNFIPNNNLFAGVEQDHKDNNVPPESDIDTTGYIVTNDSHKSSYEPTPFLIPESISIHAGPLILFSF